MGGRPFSSTTHQRGCHQPVGPRPRQDSNLRTRFRKPVLCPLSYEGNMKVPPRLAPRKTHPIRKTIPDIG